MDSRCSDLLRKYGALDMLTSDERTRLVAVQFTVTEDEPLCFDLQLKKPSTGVRLLEIDGEWSRI